MLQTAQALEGAYFLNVMALPNFLAALGLALACYWETLMERASAPSRRLAVFASLMGFYFLAFGLAYCSTDKHAALAWMRLAYLAVPFIPAAVFDLTIHALGLERSSRRIALAFWAISALFVLANVLTDQVVADARLMWWGYTKQYGPIGWLCTAYFALAVSYCIHVVRRESHRRLKGSVSKRRATLIFKASLVLCLASVDFLPGFGLALYPCGYLPTLGFVAIIIHTRLRYGARLFSTSLAADDILSTMTEALFVLDETGTVLLANAAAGRLLGAPATELIGRTADDFLPKGFFRKTTGDLLANGEPRRQEMTLSAADGRTIVVDASASLSRDRNGDLVGILLSLMDIAERKAAEAELQRYREKLEEQVRMRTVKLEREIEERKRVERALKRAKEAAETANESKGVFLANMSHEIRTPLNGLLGMLQVLRATAVSPKQKELADIALTSGRSLLSIISDILDISKIESGKLEMVEEPYCLTALAGQIDALFSSQRGDKNPVLCWTIAPSLPSAVYGDPGKLRQVLFNLIGNAVKFAPGGGVVRVEIKPDASGTRLAFRVTDNGIGIPKDKLQSVFEPFTQVNGSSTRVHHGVGLGLTISKRLVGLMGGSLAIESDEGLGTRVSFDIPLVAAPEALLPDKAPAPSVGPSNLRILLVEDEAVNRLFLRRLLEDAGHFVLCAGDGREALDMLSKERIDLALMDIRMPEMDGVQATQAIRSLERDRGGNHLPIIALTAHAMKGDRETFLDAGMDDYLAKPVDMETLNAAIARVMAGKPSCS